MCLALLVGAALMIWPALTLTVFAYRGQEKEPRPHPAQSAFTYQGQLRDGAEPANGVYDFQFTLYAVQTGGEGLGSIVSEGLVLTNGSFKAQLDFGRAVFDAPESWLEIAVRPGGSAEAYTSLSPRQKLAPTPYAIVAQQERWSLIGNPVGFNRGADKTTIAADAVVDDSVIGAKTADDREIKSLDSEKNAATMASNGTANFIAKFDASGNPTANSMMFDTGDKVGVGTTGPEQTLHVNGPSEILSTGSGAGFKFRNRGSTTSADDWVWYSSGNKARFWRAGVGDLLGITTNGNVGIGTTDPGAQLHVSRFIPPYIHVPGQPPPSLTQVAVSRLFTDPFGTGTTEATDFIIKDGNVGIGTANPAAKLEVRATNADIRLDNPGQSGLNFKTLAGSETEIQYNSGAGASGLTFRNGFGAPIVKFTGGSNVGIGTANPAAKLHVENGNGLFNHSLGRVDIQASDGSIEIFRAGGVPYIDFKNSLGVDFDLRIQQQPDNSLAILKGDGSGSTVSVGVLQITGGSDLAEPFEVGEAETIQPGMVVAIDPEQPGRLRLANKAYDRAVAGIVSGANGIKPGLTMKQEGTLANGSLPVALTGRVYCWADPSNGPIEPGDLLTTSNTPGHAMKVTDYAKAQSAIIGKAMSALKEGRGMVLVLVTLQ
jgi:hypothetical protein